MSRSVFDGQVIGHDVEKITTMVGGQSSGNSHQVTIALEPDGHPLYEISLTPEQALALAAELTQLAKS